MLSGRFGIFNRFPKVYWVVQSFELMERAAYYTMLPILVIHAYYNVGIPYSLALILTIFMYPFQYGLPIFSGAYAEKGGYRRQMIFAFSFLTMAYLFLSFAFNSMTMILAVILIGIGIGSYKPLISATVAKCTPQKDRNIAFSIYYLIVNLAAASFPIIYVLFEFTGVLVAPFYYMWVFRIGTIFFMLNLFIAVFIFQEVPRSGHVKTVGDVVKNIKIAFKDKKFLVMVILIGGFWALYSSFLNILPLVLIGYRLVPLWFTAMVLGIFNPLTIILAGPFLAKFGEKIESIKLLLGGVLVYIIGLTIIGLSLQWHLVIIGIIFASIGEFMVAPGYLAFVSKLAPKEKVSSYIGCNFLATMLGITLGTLVFGTIASVIAFDMGRPSFMYGILISFGLALLVAFIVYYRSWGQDIIARARKIRELEEGIDEEFEGITYKEPILFRVFDHKFATIVPLILIPVILFGTFSLGTKHFYGVLEEEEEIPLFKIENHDIIDGFSDNFGGNLNEGDSTIETVNIELEDNNFPESITFELTWQDEADYKRTGISPRTWENQPDEFSLTVSEGENFTKTVSDTNTHGSEGRITITIEFEHDTVESTNGTGEWVIEITLVTCGDFTNNISPIVYTDSANNYELSVTTEVYTPKE